MDIFLEPKALLAIIAVLSTATCGALAIWHPRFRRWYQEAVEIEAKSSTATATAPSPTHRHQLPTDLADFVGRDRETAELEALLLGDGAAAAITAIGGMGGIGKSALAIHVAHRLVDRYPDGQLVVDMGGTSDQPLEPAAAMERVIHSFEPGARLPDEADAVAALYRSILSDKRALIILDNASDGAQVRPLIPPPPCAAMVTSRQGIALDGVRSFDLDALSENEARGLLGAILGPGRVGEAELAGLAGACGRLPLALRVAGAFLKLHPDWTVAEYLAALADQRKRLRRLRIEGDVELDVLASLGLSVAQLAREQADLAARWRMLGVFAGDFERAAAAAVWDVPSAEARDGLSALVGRSMVLFDGDAARYRLHDLMRDVARGADLAEADLAALAPIEERAAARYAEHYLGVLGSADELYLRGDDGITAGLALFDLERRNIEAGQDWAARTSLDDDAAAGVCGRYPIAGAYVLNLRLHARSRVGWLEASVGAARRLHDRAMEGVALGNLGLAYAALGETRRAIEFYEQQLVIAREIGDRRGEGNALGNLGVAYRNLGETRRAIEFHEQALKVSHDIGDRRAEGQDLGNLGNAYAELGETRRAIEFYEQQLVIVREIGDRLGEGNALGNLGNAYAALGETRRAIEFYEQQLVIVREIGDRRGEGAALGNLGLAYADHGETRRAIEFYEQRLEIAREIGERRGEGNALGNLGIAYAALGETHRAIEFHEQDLEIAREIGDRRGEGNALGNLGNAYAELGETRRAIEFHEHALKVSRDIGDRRAEGQDLYNLGHALAKAGERGQAITLLQEALKIFEEIEAPYADQARAALARLKSDD
ncbi:MAG: tetratricopeptide repeat protein [Alphaproteobacteria bacterium]